MDVRLEKHRRPLDDESEIDVFVQLSERNLRDLMAQFEDDRFVGRAPYADLHRLCGGIRLHVEVIGDAAHYGDRVPGIGGGNQP